MKTLVACGFLFLSFQAYANFCETPDEILVSFPDDRSFCYVSAPLENGDISNPERLWEQTVSAIDDLQQKIHNGNYNFKKDSNTSEKVAEKYLNKCYGNLDYAARVSGHSFSGLARSYFETAILAVAGKKGPSAVNVKLARMKNVDAALKKSLEFVQSQRSVNSCQGDYEERIRELAKKSAFGPAIIGALTGTTATLTAGLYAMSLGPAYPLWLANLVGREVYKLPFATIAPVAGWIGLGIGAATFVGYEGILLAKIIGMAKTLDLIRSAAKGSVKPSFAHKLGNFAKGVAKTHRLSEEKFQNVIAQAITTMDAQGMPQRHAVWSAEIAWIDAHRTWKSTQTCGPSLPNKKDIIDFLDENPDYLVAQTQPAPVKSLLEHGATTTHVEVHGCKTQSSQPFVPGGNILSLKAGHVITAEDWNEVGMNSKRTKRPHYSNLVLKSKMSTLPDDVVKGFKECLVPSKGDDAAKTMILKIADAGLNPYAGGRTIVLGDVAMEKKQKDDGLKIDFNEMDVMEKARQSYPEEEKNIVLGFKIQFAKADPQTESTWANCIENDYRILPEVGDEVLLRHHKAIKEQAEANAARRTFAGKKLLWLTHIVRPDLNKWKRIVTIVEIDKEGVEDKLVSYEQCFPETFEFPILLSASTGNVMEEIQLKPIRTEIK